MIGVGTYVRLGGGVKVYQVVAEETMPRHDKLGNRVGDGMVRQFKIDATADHPDAAVRVQDAFAWYVESDLVEVRRR